MKHDITTYNTKKLFAKALKKAMRSKPFSKITVSELVRDCGLNRKTFYYHFEDIYALLKWMFEEESIEIVKRFDLLVDYEQAIRFAMDYVERNDYIINCIYDSIGRDEMQRFLYADFIGVVSSVLDAAETEAGTRIDPSFKAYIARFYTEALAGMLIAWAKEKNRSEHREKTLQYLKAIIGASLSLMKSKLDPQ